MIVSYTEKNTERLMVAKVRKHQSQEVLRFAVVSLQ